MSDPRAICERKVAYLTRAKAAEIATRMGRKRGLRAYRCEVCGFFHVGHEASAESKARHRSVRRGLAA